MKMWNARVWIVELASQYWAKYSYFFMWTKNLNQDKTERIDSGQFQGWSSMFLTLWWDKNTNRRKLFTI